MEKSEFRNIDDYIEHAPIEVQKKLRELKAVIKAEVPDAQERIAYGMPTFSQYGNLVHFAAFKNHIGFLSSAIRDREFQRRVGKIQDLQGDCTVSVGGGNSNGSGA